MRILQPETTNRRTGLAFVRGLASLGALAAALALACVTPRPAAARIDVEGISQLDSATAVASGASASDGHHAGPLAVPDQFGPGSVLGVGNLRMKIINNGILGNPFTNTSTDPSAQWPGASGVEYLNAIYLMVAAVNPTATDPTSVRRCSFGREWRPPTLNPEDKIYRAYDGIINGARFVNDDGDHDDDPSIGSVARIDEDFLDGRDDDGDGKIDED